MAAGDSKLSKFVAACLLAGGERGNRVAESIVPMPRQRACRANFWSDEENLGNELRHNDVILILPAYPRRISRLARPQPQLSQSGRWLVPDL